MATASFQHNARDRSLPAGGPARHRGAVSARVRPRRRRREPPALGLAVPPQSEQSRRRTAAVGRARRTDDHRSLRHDARALVARRERNPGRMGHRRHGGTRTPATGPGRGAVSHVGPQRRRRARSRTVECLLAAPQEDALSRRAVDSRPREAADASRRPRPAVADAR